MSTENDAGKFDEEDGNRIATWLTYLNEPKHGGDTVFLGPGKYNYPLRVRQSRSLRDKAAQ